MASRTDTRTGERRRDRSRGSTLTNAFVGAVVTVVLSFIPFSPVLGGAVAAYLQKGDSDESIKVGAISGVIAAAPLILLITFGLGFLSLLPLAEGEPVATGFFWVIILISVGLILLYSVGSSAVGGFVGHVFVEREDRRQTRREADRQARSRPRSEREGWEGRPDDDVDRWGGESDADEDSEEGRLVDDERDDSSDEDEDEPR
jgi:hypothetical protein